MTGLKEIEEEDHMIWLEKQVQEKGVLTIIDMIWKLAHKTNMKKKTMSFELNCPAIISLTAKTNLNHKERTALMMLYLALKDEDRLMEIMRMQDNFNEKICHAQIINYKKSGFMKGISCEKLIEWHICNDNFSDCNKHKEASNAKPS